MKKYKFKKFNRRTKREYAQMILDRYERNLMSFDGLYRNFWELFRNTKINQTWKNRSPKKELYNSPPKR